MGEQQFQRGDIVREVVSYIQGEVLDYDARDGFVQVKAWIPDANLSLVQRKANEPAPAPSAESAVEAIRQRQAERHAENARILELYADYRPPRFDAETLADIDALLAALDAERERSAALLRYLQSARSFLTLLASEPLGESADSYRREAKEDVELALRALGVDVQALSAGTGEETE